MEAKCSKCKSVFKYSDADFYWDYKGVDYDTKLVKCKYCEEINIIGYWKHRDRSKWEYEYEKW